MKYLFLILLVSCGGMDFKKVEKLSSFRILGILADTPEISVTGGTVQLEVIISDTSGEENLINGTYEWCLDPGISFGAAINCDHDSSSSLTSFQIDMSNLLPDSSYRTGQSNLGLNVVIPPLNSLSSFNNLTSYDENDLYNGISFIVIFHFPDQNVKSFKRIVMTSRNDLNQNPSITDLLLNGSSLTAAPVKNDLLALTSSAPESYTYVTADNKNETRQETLQVAWYANEGSFNFSKVFVDENIKYQGDESASLVLAILRDGRGGIAFKKFSAP